jgi:AcrR family transcriptional regulator
VNVAKPKSRREQRNQATREQILRAAAELFSRQGYQGTSLDDLVERANLARGTLYYHFPGKEDIVLALGQESTRQIIEAFEERLSAGERAIALLGDVLESFARTAVAQPEISRVYILTGLARIEDLTADLERPSFSRFLVRLVAAGQDQGDVRSDIPARVLGTLLAMQAITGVLLGLPLPAGLPAQLRALVGLFLDGARAGKAKVIRHG